MAAERVVRVEVVYAMPDSQESVMLDMPAGASVKDAIRRSGLEGRYPEIGASGLRPGIYGKSVPPETLLHEGDRIEIYRPLLADPKQARRRRAARER